MGFGDDVMATGMARGAIDRGELIAFGDGRRIIWGPHSPEIFRRNPNIAVPGQERDRRVRWINYHRGNRQYNRLGERRWIWNMSFRATPGEFFFDEQERAFALSLKPGFLLVEPNLPWHKHVAINKDWGFERWQRLTTILLAFGERVCQFEHGKKRLTGVDVIPAQTFRQAAAALTRARLAILPEGGLHHAAAAVGLPAIVIFGGFIPPQTVGYAGHVNLTGGAGAACGLHTPCAHCRAALDSITVEEVVDLARNI